MDIGATTTGLTDMLSDNQRQRLYIANPGLNRVEVFDMRQQQFLTPITVGQMPRSMALGNDGNTLYVANSGGETISIVDLNQGVTLGRVNYPPIPFNATFAADHTADPCVQPARSAGDDVRRNHVESRRSSVTPRTLNHERIRHGAGRFQGRKAWSELQMALSCSSLRGTEAGYLYDAGIDDFVTGRIGHWGARFRVTSGPSRRELTGCIIWRTTRS